LSEQPFSRLSAVVLPLKKSHEGILLQKWGKDLPGFFIWEIYHGKGYKIV